MGIQSYPSGISGQPDVLLTNLKEGQGLNWDAATGRWINGKEFVNPPTITSPAADATIQAAVAFTVTCSAFVGASGMNLVWFDNDWEFATDIQFQNVFLSYYNQTGSATSISATVPVGYASCFIRVRQNTVDRKGIYSAPVRIVLRQIQYFTTSGNFSVPANTSTVSVSLVGGGSGAAIQATGAGGGGAVLGATNVSVTPGATIAVTVGAGGSSTSGGGTTTFSGQNAAGAAGTAGANTTGKVSGAGTNGGTGGSAVGGGGGGAGGAGNNANVPNGGPGSTGGNGGNGVTLAVDGVTRGGGGGGGSNKAPSVNYDHTGGSGAGGGTNGVSGLSANNPNPSPTFASTPADGSGGGAGGNWGAGGSTASTGGNGVAILTWTF
jgi:hypothetical protein